MKKIVVCLMLVMGVTIFGAIEKKLVKNENGSYSGSATLQLVARGRIVKKPVKQMLVINEVTENGAINSELEFQHKGLKEGKENVLNKKIKTEILEEGKDGKMSPIKLDNKVIAKIIDENNNVIAGKNIDIKTLDGAEIGKVTYNLKNRKQKDRENIQEITSKVRINSKKSGNFIDKSATLVVAINN